MTETDESEKKKEREKNVDMKKTGKLVHNKAAWFSPSICFLESEEYRLLNHICKHYKNAEESSHDLSRKKVTVRGVLRGVDCTRINHCREIVPLAVYWRKKKLFRPLFLVLVLV